VFQACKTGGIVWELRTVTGELTGIFFSKCWVHLTHKLCVRAEAVNNGEKFVEQFQVVMKQNSRTHEFEKWMHSRPSVLSMPETSLIRMRARFVFYFLATRNCSSFYHLIYTTATSVWIHYMFWIRFATVITVRGHDSPWNSWNRHSGRKAT